MRALLDTHTFLWFVTDDARLSSHAKEVMENSGTTLEISVASLWEIAIKSSLGKLILPKPFNEVIPAQLLINAIEILPIKVEHLSTLVILPRHHRDPFDRLIVAQSITEGITLISGDATLDAYDIQRIW